MDRIQLLEHWLSEVLKGESFQCIPLAGDASCRRYYRVWVNDERDEHYVVMDAPPPETIEPFIEVANLLNKQTVTVPTIFAKNIEDGFLLLSDFGDRLYLKELNMDNAEKLYRDAMQSLLKIHKTETTLPKFDGSFMWRQWENLFLHWYLEKHLKLKDAEDIFNKMKPVLAQIIRMIETQPKVMIHRDYHSRNLMILDNQNPGVIDFQDAMQGPVTYDLVSLFQDCYIRWDRNQVEKWVFSFHQQAMDEKLIQTSVSKDQFLQWFDWTGLQRHFKNFGIFTSVFYRDGKSGYLKDIPMLFHYIFKTCERYPELSSLVSFFQDFACQEEKVCAR